MSCGCYHGWLRLCASFHAFVGRQFGRWSGFVYHHPAVVIVFSLLVSFGLMSGFLKYNVYGQAERLFYPQNSEVYKALDRVEKHFDYYTQNEEFILKSKTDGNILNKETFELAYRMNQDLMRLDGFREFCVLSVDSSCVVLSPLELFPGNHFSNPGNKLFMALADNSTVMSNGLSARRNFPIFFGNFKTDATNASLSGNVLRVSYPVRFAKTRKDYERNSKWELKMVEYLKEMKRNLSNQDIDVSFNTIRGISDSIAQNTKDNMRLIVVSIGSMIVFCVFAMVNWKSKVKGHILISLVGILAVMFGIGGGFGLALLMGQPYVGFIGVLPFLVLGIGIDDMFIIVGHLDRVDSKLQGAERLSEAMSNAGFSILMTTLTDLVAFVIGTVSVFPAVQIFCVFAFLSILFAFLMINTFFLAVLSFDMKRIHNDRLDCLPCFKKNVDATPEVEEKHKPCSYKMMKAYGFFLMKPAVKGIVLLFATLMLAFGVYGTINTSLEFDYKISGASSSPYIDWLTTLETSFPFGVFQMDVILDEPNVNYADPTVQKEYQKLDLIATRVPELNPKMTINWMSAYIQFCKHSNISSTKDFNQNFQIFLQQFKEFEIDVNLNSRNDITASRIHFFTKDKASWSFRKDALVNLRNELNTMDLDFYPVSFTFIYLSHLVVIVKATLCNVGICCGVVLFLTLTFVARPTASMLLLFSFLSFMLELLGVMYVWDLSLNSVTMIVIVMAIGFAVDYNCHIVHGYLSSDKDTPNLRMIDSLITMGACVLKGAISTMIGVLVLSISSSKLFRLFFKMMFSIITLGLIHGMVILPVLLTFLIRTSGPKHEDLKRKDVTRESKKGLLKSSHQNGAAPADDKITTL